MFTTRSAEDGVFIDGASAEEVASQEECAVGAGGGGDEEGEFSRLCGAGVVGGDGWEGGGEGEEGEKEG